MATSQIVVLALVFLCAAGLSAAAMMTFVPQAGRARVRRVLSSGAAENVSAWKEKVIEALSPAAKLTLPENGWEKSSLRKRFMHAGIRDEKAILFFFGVKTLLTLGLPLAFMLAAGIGHVSLSFNGALMTLVGLAAIGYYSPNLWLRHKVRVRQREVFEKLPDAIDLMTVMVEAGLGLDAAITRVGQEMGLRSGVMEEEFKLVGLELRAGAGRAQALRNLAARTGVEEMELLVAMLVQTDKFGTSMAESLRVHSESLRTKRRLKAEEAAAKIAIKLLFPLLMCIFPSIMIVLMGPAVISIYRVFFPIASGS